MSTRYITVFQVLRAGEPITDWLTRPEKDEFLCTAEYDDVKSLDLELDPDQADFGLNDISLLSSAAQAACEEACEEA